MVHTINIKSNILVNGIEASQDAHLKGNVILGDGGAKQATIRAATTVEDSLRVNGKTTLADVDVEGVFSFKNNVNLNGNITIGDGTSFKQALFNANSVFNKPVQVESTMNVSGKTTLKDVDVSGEFSFKNVVFPQKPTFSDGMNVQGDVDVSGTIKADRIETGVFSFKNGTFEVDLDCKKNVTVDGVLKANTLEVTNMQYQNAIFNDETYFNRPLNAQIIRAADVEVSGNVMTSGDIYSNAEISGRHGFFYNLTSLGKTELRDDVKVTGDVEIGKNTRLLGDLFVTGSIQTYDDANVKNITATNSVVASTIQTSSNIDIRGDAKFRNNVTIEKSGTFGELTVGGTAHIHELKTDIVTSGSFSVENIVTKEIMQVSDRRFKKDIETLDSRDMASKVNKLRPVSFNWNHDGSPEIGFIAQEVQEVFPEFVSQTNGVIGVKYANMVSVLVACIQDLQQQIDAMKNA